MHLKNVSDYTNTRKHVTFANAKNELMVNSSVDCTLADDIISLTLSIGQRAFTVEIAKRMSFILRDDHNKF